MFEKLDDKIILDLKSKLKNGKRKPLSIQVPNTPMQPKTSNFISETPYHKYFNQQKPPMSCNSNSGTDQ
jgi:hypothetical protein